MNWAGQNTRTVRQFFSSHKNGSQGPESLSVPPQMIRLFSRSDLIIKGENNLNSGRDTNLFCKYPFLRAIQHDTLRAQSHSECWSCRVRLCTERHKRQFLKPYQCPQNMPTDVFPHSLTYLAFFRNSYCNSPKTAQRRKNKWLLIVLWMCFQIPLMMLLWSKGLCGPKSACENTMLPLQAFRAGCLEDNPIRSPSLHCGISALKRRPQTTILPLPSTKKNARKLPSSPTKLAGTLNLDFSYYRIANSKVLLFVKHLGSGAVLQ